MAFASSGITIEELGDTAFSFVDGVKFGATAGHFAVINVDPQSARIDIELDPTESRNVFYFCDGERGLVSNDLGLLVRAIGRPRVDETTLLLYLRYGKLSTSSRTFFDGVSKLRAGQRLSLAYGDAPKCVVGTVEKRALKMCDIDRHDALEQMSSILQAFVRGAASVVSKPASLLGSGIDTVLPSEIARRAGIETPTLTLTFDDEAYDDVARTRALREIGSGNQAVVCGIEGMAQLQETIRRIGHPINGLASYATMAAYDTTAKNRYGGLLTGVGYYLWVPIDSSAIDRIMAQPHAAYTGSGEILPEDDYLGAAFASMKITRDDDDFSDGLWGTDLSPLKRHIADTVFIRRTPHVAFDHAALAAHAGVEFLSPHMNGPAYEFCRGLPDHVAFDAADHGSLLFSLFRKWFGRSYPNTYFMHAPQREYIRGPYRKAILELIRESRLGDLGYIDRDRLSNMFLAYLDRPGLGNSFFVWKFIAAEIWYRTFFNEEAIVLTAG